MPATTHPTSTPDGFSPAFGPTLLSVARAAIESHWSDRPSVVPTPSEAALGRPFPVFVTLWDPRGRLRGCVGTLTARTPSVIEETWSMAREAAFSDPRFPALTHPELAGLRCEVSVVQPLQDVDDPRELDPRIDGVLVSTPDGRRGALLPDVEGVETVAQQLALARRKGRIDAEEPVRIRRFRVDKFRE